MPLNLCLHELVTNADYVLQPYIYGLLKEEPKATHFIARISR